MVPLQLVTMLFVALGGLGVVLARDIVRQAIVFSIYGFALVLLFDLVHFGAPFWWVAGQALHLLLVIAHRTGEATGAVALLPAMADAAFALMVGGGLWLALWRTRWRRWG